MDEASVYKLAEWRLRPVQFVEEALHVTPDAWQRDVLEAFPHDQRIAMKACKGPGKTCVISWCACNFLATRPDAQIAATSISGDNLSDGLWKEMATWISRSPFMQGQFDWTKTRISHRARPATWFMSARTWAKSASPEQQADTLAGFHADYLLFILDEAGGIPMGVLVAAEAGLSTGTETKLLIAGNPTHTDGPLYDACNDPRGLWKVIEITGDPADPKRSPRISKEWAQNMIDKWGRDHPWVMVNVLGKFPPSSMNTLLGYEEVKAAMDRHYTQDQYVWAQKRIGIDVARFGDDRTILFPRQGLVAFQPVEMRKVRTTEIAARAMLGVKRWGGDVELYVDDTGHWGHGVIDNLIASGYSPVGIQYHTPAIDPRYGNRRAEMWFGMAEWIKRGGALPFIHELIAELTVPKYFFRNGKLWIEEKDMIKATLQRSPDLGDGLANTFAVPDAPAHTEAQRLTRSIVDGNVYDTPDPMHDVVTISGMNIGSNWDYDPLEREQ